VPNKNALPSISIEFLLIFLFLIITVSEEDIDFGDNDDLNELFIEDDDDSLEPNDGEIIFKFPFID
jgi:hypothetical protein